MKLSEIQTLNNHLFGSQGVSRHMQNHIFVFLSMTLNSLQFEMISLGLNWLAVPTETATRSQILNTRPSTSVMNYGPLA